MEDLDKQNNFVGEWCQTCTFSMSRNAKVLILMPLYILSDFSTGKDLRNRMNCIGHFFLLVEDLICLHCHDIRSTFLLVQDLMWLDLQEIFWAIFLRVEDLNNTENFVGECQTFFY